jgi:hypothetical protein
VKVDVGVTPLYVRSEGDARLADVARLNRFGQDIYLERLESEPTRVQVRVVGRSPLDGEIGWVEREAIESAGERCPAVYSRN